MIDVNRLCPGCMRLSPISAEKGSGDSLHSGETTGGAKAPVAGRGVCPFCGFSLEHDVPNTSRLPMYTILAGKYLTGKVLGQGGFGITYIGFDLNMETRIAIKEYFPVGLVRRDTDSYSGAAVLSLKESEREIYEAELQKFVSEARSLSRFSDMPGVVSVKDFFYENGTAYMVMEYIDGISLSAYLNLHGRLSEEETLALMKPLLETLAVIHDSGVVHRDISPGNIMMTFAKGEDGSYTPTFENLTGIRLIDFGAARMFANNLEKSMTVVVKNGYAPEEQYYVHGNQGPWTDVYSICATMYRMLSGVRPVSSMDRYMQDQLQPLSQMGIAVSEQTSETLRKGLAVRKENRIQDIRTLIRLLYDTDTGTNKDNEKETQHRRDKHSGQRKSNHKSETSRKNRSSRRKWGMILAVLVMAAALAGGVIFLTGQNSDRKLQQEVNSGSGLSASDAESSATGENEPDAAGGVSSAESENDQAVQAITDETELSTAETDLSAGVVISREPDTEQETETEAPREIVAVSTPQTSYATANAHAIACLDDGTVVTMGSNLNQQRNVSEWTDIVAVAAGTAYSAGLRADGTVVVAGELEGKNDVERWDSIVSIAGGSTVLYGLTTEGTIIASYISDSTREILQWENVKAIACQNMANALSALTEEGEILSLLYEDGAETVTGWENVESICSAVGWVFGLTADGNVKYTCLDDYSHSYAPEGLENFQNIVQIYPTWVACFCVTSDGSLCAAPWDEEYDWYISVMDEPVLSWTNLAGITGAGLWGVKYLGIQKDGTILTAIENEGNSSPEEMQNLSWVKAALGDVYYDTVLMGVTADGTYYTYGTESSLLEFVYLDYDGISVADADLMLYWHTNETCCEAIVFLDTNGLLWRQNDSHLYEQADSNVAQMACSHNVAISYIVELRTDGTVSILFANESGWTQETLLEAENWTDMMQVATITSREYSESGGDLPAVFGLRADGTVACATENTSVAQEVSAWTDITSLYSGIYALGAIRADGTAVFVEDGSEYNFGQYNTEGWEDLVQLALGVYHTVGLRSDGTVYATGRNDAGQCDVEEWTDVVYISAGECCTLGIQSDGTLLIAGEAVWGS